MHDSDSGKSESILESALFLLESEPESESEISEGATEALIYQRLSTFIVARSFLLES